MWTWHKYNRYRQKIYNCLILAGVPVVKDTSGLDAERSFTCHLTFVFIQLAHPSLGPLVFYSARGLERKEQDHSYLNLAEVSEVVKRVVQLADDWPDVWGPKDLKQIAVLSAYRFQVHVKCCNFI